MVIEKEPWVTERFDALTLVYIVNVHVLIKK